MDPARDRVVEFAAVPFYTATVETNTGSLPTYLMGGGVSSLVYPGIPIPPEASAVHHLIDEDVEGAPPLGRAVDLVLGPLWRSAPERIFVAHNARFDRPFLPMLHDGAQWVCTYRCALHVWPDAPGFSNQTLSYWLQLPVPRDLPAHRALTDATVTAHLFLRLLAERSLEDLAKLTRKAAVLKTLPFGKHKGEAVTAVPTSYLEWILREEVDDPDARYTAKFELARRRNLLTVRSEQ
jgi:exodeoxyribonuclease X